MLHLVIPTDIFIPKRFAAYTYGFLILVRPKHKDDMPLIEHEKVHVRQFWRYFGMSGLLYMFSKKYRLKFEVEAFRRQLELVREPQSAKKLFAFYLASNYNLDITKEEALKLLD